jgi:hypothetical protein
MSNACRCVGCVGYERQKLGTGYARIEWTELAPGEGRGGRTILRESRFHDADFGGRAGALAAAAERVAKVKTSPTPGRITSTPIVVG